MSDSLIGALTKPIGIDYLTPLMQQAQIAKAQQETGLLGQQVQGAALTNQLNALRLGIRGTMASQVLGGAAPAPQSFLPGGGGGSGAADGGPGGAAGGAGTLPTAGTHSSGMPAPGQVLGDRVGPAGVQTAYGVPLPVGQAMAVIGADDPSAALKSAMEQRRQRVFELLSQPDWQQGVTQAYQEGWIDPQHYQELVRTPQNRAAYLNGLASPEGYMGALEKYAGMGMTLDPRTGQPVISNPAMAAAAGHAAAAAGGEAAGRLSFAEPLARASAAGQAAGSGALVTIDVRQADGTTVPIQVLPSKVAETLARFPGSVENPGNAGMIGAVKNAIYGQESGFGVNPATSSAGAVGGFQIKPETFQQYARPGEKIGVPADNAAVGQRIIDDLWKKTGGDPMRTMVGYFSGPENVAPPGSPNPWKVDAVDTNGMHTSDYVRQSMLRMLNQNQPVAGVGVAKLGAPQMAGLDIAGKQAATDQQAVTGSLAAAEAAQQQQVNLIQMRQVGAHLDTGSLGEARQSVQSYLASFAPEVAQRFVSSLTAGKVDASKAADTQEFVKLALQAASQAEKANNPQGGLGITQVYQSTFPNVETQPTAIRDMSNLFLINKQRIIDHAQGQQAFLSQQQAAMQNDPRAYKPLNNYEAEFLKTNGPAVYVAAAAALNDKPYAVWSKGLSQDQQKAALGVLWRADPTAEVVGPDGRRRHNPALAGNP